MTSERLSDAIRKGQFDRELREVYPMYDDLEPVRERMARLSDYLSSAYGEHEEVHLFSAPGRVEVGGNHTDHQRGIVLAAAVDRDIAAAAAVNGTQTVRVLSDGYPEIIVDLSKEGPQSDERESSASLIRGCAEELRRRGYPVGGFDACVHSFVLNGSGMSSSAAFEVLIGSVMNGLFCGGKVTPVEIAKIGQIAENVYFGKPSGLMDQMSSAVGGFVSIDFRDTAVPLIRKIDFDLEKAGLALFVIDCGADHAKLTDEYAAIPNEMRSVAALFGEEVLREVDEEMFYERVADVRSIIGDRAVLRTIHFFDENRRAAKEATVLEAGDVTAFLKLVNESGISSFIHLQNVVISGQSKEQDMAFALAVTEKALRGRGAFRVMGGGFAGTLQAFVPLEMAEDFIFEVERLLFAGAVHAVGIRSVGCCQIL